MPVRIWFSSVEHEEAETDCRHGYHRGASAPPTMLGSLYPLSTRRQRESSTQHVARHPSSCSLLALCKNKKLSPSISRSGFLAHLFRECRLGSLGRLNPHGQCRLNQQELNPLTQTKYSYCCCGNLVLCVQALGRRPRWVATR